MKKKAAKYLNSPESDIYHKSKVLYGIYHAKQSIAKEDNCYLVEGYTDVIQFNQTGVNNVVSSSGTALTSDQIRLISRLTKNITVLFDSDAAGMRASIRGIDLILEQGMNVKVCSFPEGEDPDSFAKQNTLEELTLYLEENVQDFISFKASLLQKESKNDPIKKAELIRDMVTSISKIPDVIKREIYVRECSRIMDISEDVLFDTLAQIRNIDVKDQRKQQKQEKKSLEIVTSDAAKSPKVDEQYELERKIIEILLLYGQREEEFEDLILKENDDGELVLEPEIYTTKVFEKIYLDLQDDEIEFTSNVFMQAYSILIERLHQEEDFKIESFINHIPSEMASEITAIMMNEERYSLHRWHDMEIHVKQKEYTVSQYVSDIILNLRRFLISQKVEELSQEVKAQNTDDNQESIQDIMDYLSLKRILSEKLNRVV